MANIRCCTGCSIRQQLLTTWSDIRSPAFYGPGNDHGCAAGPGVEQRDFSKLETMFYGAPNLGNRVAPGHRGLPVSSCRCTYGMTETTGTVVNLHPVTTVGA